MTTISASTSADPNNPLDYATAMGNIVSGMQANTISQVGSVLGGLPTISNLTQGAYGFENSVIKNSQDALNQTLFGTPQQNNGKNIATPQSVGVEGMLSNETNQLTPILANLGQQAATNQAAAIQSQAATAQAVASSAGGSSKK
jgi:hypothetical protein